MADISKITVGSDEYDVKDATAREWIANAIDLFYPVGSVIVNFGVNPGTYLTGTSWERTAVGKAVVGVDPSNTLMNSAEKTFGRANAIIPSHNHSITGGSHSHTVNAHNHKAPTGWYWSTYKGTRVSEDVGEIAGTGWTMSQVVRGGAWGGSQVTQTTSPGTNSIAHNHTCSTVGEVVTDKNYQPSMAFYIWKRTA